MAYCTLPRKSRLLRHRGHHSCKFVETSFPPARLPPRQSQNVRTTPPRRAWHRHRTRYVDSSNTHHRISIYRMRFRFFAISPRLLPQPRLHATGGALRPHLARAHSRFVSQVWTYRPPHQTTERLHRLRRPYAALHTIATANLENILPHCRPNSGITDALLCRRFVGLLLGRVCAGYNEWLPVRRASWP